MTGEPKTKIRAKSVHTCFDMRKRLEGAARDHCNARMRHARQPPFPVCECVVRRTLLRAMAKRHSFSIAFCLCSKAGFTRGKGRRRYVSVSKLFSAKRNAAASLQVSNGLAGCMRFRHLVPCNMLEWLCGHMSSSEQSLSLNVQLYSRKTWFA